jgi:hypothetical protein
MLRLADGLKEAALEAARHMRAKGVKEIAFEHARIKYYIRTEPPVDPLERFMGRVDDEEYKEYGIYLLPNGGDTHL